MRIKTMVDGKLVSSRPRSHHGDQYMLYDESIRQILLMMLLSWQFPNVSIPDKTKSGLKLINPLAGILVCAKCGKAMCYQSYPARPETAARYTHKSSQICKVKSAVASDVMDAVAYSLEKIYF